MLKSNEIASDGAIALAKALQLNNSIVEFDISDNSIGDRGGMEFARMLQVNRSLQSLGISGCSLKINSLIALWTVIRNNEYITHFDISNNMPHTSTLTQSLSNDVMIHLSRAITGNATLKHLNLSKSGITDWSTCDLLCHALQTCSELEILDLST